MLLKLDKKPLIHIRVHEYSPQSNAYFLNINSLLNSKFINQKGILFATKYFKNFKTNFRNKIVLKILIIQILLLNL